MLSGTAKNLSMLNAHWSNAPCSILSDILSNFCVDAKAENSYDIQAKMAMIYLVKSYMQPAICNTQKPMVISGKMQHDKCNK